MSAIDKQLQKLADKDALHRMIDKLPDDAQVLILCCLSGSSLYNTFGNPTLERLLWMVRSFEHTLIDE